MPKIIYEYKNFRSDTQAIIDQADMLCRQYQQQGYELTLRQLFYQFVSRGWIPNTDKSYKRLGSIVNDARLAGQIDWMHISDRTRHLRRFSGWDSPSQIIEASASQFTRSYWDVSGQVHRPEVWVEKDALVDVVARACNDRQVPYFSCRGYVSQSEMWRAGQRIKRHFDAGYVPVVFHLGDHDPSGIDMTRDITERLETFAGRPVDVRRIALTMSQINQYNPPPNPAKITDSRASGYIDEFGYQSWELDALEPSVIVDLIKTHVETTIDFPLDWDDAVQEDQGTRDRMTDVATRWDEIYSRWNEIEDLLDS